MSATKRQRRVLRCSGPLLVLGRPGTGKTTCGLLKAEQVIARGLEPHQRVLFLSFSNAAVQRIQASAKKALHWTVRPALEITTFHAFSFGLLRSHARLVGVQTPVGVLLPEDVRVLDATFKGDVQVEKARMEREGLVTFDRFAPLAVRLLESHPPICAALGRRYPVVIIDEYQDTDDYQNRVALLLTRSSQLICLGDPEQRIYDFLPGVRPDRLDRLRAAVTPTEVLLKKNHRSGGSDVTTYARAVLTGAATVPTCGAVAVIGYWNSAGQADAVKWAIFQAERAMRQAGVKGDITVAVMGRTNSFVGRISQALRQESPRVKHPLSHRVLVVSEELSAAWALALRVLEFGSGEETNATCADILDLGGRFNYVARQQNKKRAEKLTGWASTLRRGALSGRAKGVHALRAGIEELGASWTGDPMRDLRRVGPMLRSLPGGHFKTIAGVLALRLPAGPGEPATASLVEAFNRSEGRYIEAQRVGQEALLRERLLDGGSNISKGRVLMTLHKCKGKEFDAVVVVDGMYGDMIVSREEREASKQPNGRKLLHVALTRARHCAIIVTPNRLPCPLLPEMV